MSPIKILASKAYKTITKTVVETGVETGVVLKYATETDKWRRTHLATSVQEKFAAEMEKIEVPITTRSAILVENEHANRNDPRTHFTYHLQDAEGNHIKTGHLAV